MKPTEDDPIRVPRSYHPLCGRCNQRHSPFEVCNSRQDDFERSATMLALGILFGIPAGCIGVVALFHWIY
jgi:hypothetical protein